MLVLSLCHQACPEAIPSNLGEKLGDGADGEVFELKGTDQVIKFSILCEYPHINIHDEFDRIEKTITYIQQTNSDICVPVLSFKKLSEGQRNIYQGLQNYILYSYVMKKCFPITLDEVKVFHTIISHEDRGIVKNYSESKIKNILSGLARGLDFDMERVIFFYMNLRQSPVAHWDLHTRNIMKDSSGNFKLIDFDRATLEK